MLGLMLLMLPVAELMLVLSLARHFGWLWVLAGLLAGFFLGSSVIRLRGALYFRQAMAAMNQQQAPDGALINGLAWYVAGVLLMIPGFITDALALLVLLPPVRRLMVSRVQKVMQGRMVNIQTIFSGHASMGGMGGTGAGPQWPPQQDQETGDVFEGEAREIAENTPVLEVRPAAKPGTGAGPESGAR